MMDDPGLAPSMHADALRGLARLNSVSRAARAVYRQIKPIAARAGGSVRLVDVAAGSADVTVGVCRAARRDGLDWGATACDVSDLALGQARSRALDAGVELDTVRLDAIEDSLPAGDVMICSLFLHHLSEADATRVLASMKASARLGVVVSDLRRCGFGTMLARVAPRVMTRSPVVHVDAVRSARAAFDLAELHAMADDAGLAGAQVRPAWPARMMLRWLR